MERSRRDINVFVNLLFSLETTSKNIQERLMKSIMEYSDQLEKEKRKMNEMSMEINSRSDWLLDCNCADLIEIGLNREVFMKTQALASSEEKISSCKPDRHKTTLFYTHRYNSAIRAWFHVCGKGRHDI